MRAASAIAATASSDAAPPPGGSQTRPIPLHAAIRDRPSITVPARRRAGSALGDPATGGAAGVGERDAGGQVARVLVEAAQQRRQPCPAADRDDPRATGEKPLLVDDLDEWLVAVRGPERADERAGHADGAERHQRDA